VKPSKTGRFQGDHLDRRGGGARISKHLARASPSDLGKTGHGGTAGLKAARHGCSSSACFEGAASFVTILVPRAEGAHEKRAIDELVGGERFFFFFCQSSDRGPFGKKRSVEAGAIPIERRESAPPPSRKGRGARRGHHGGPVQEKVRAMFPLRRRSSGARELPLNLDTTHAAPIRRRSRPRIRRAIGVFEGEARR